MAALVAVRRGRVADARVVPVLVALTGIALHGTWVVDDAGIAWAYARNIADGRGAVPYPGGPVGEGFSDPLWVFLLAAAEWVGLRADLFAKTLGLLCGVGAVVLAPLLVRDEDEVDELFVATAVATSASWLLWSASGLETALCGVLLLATTLSARVGQPAVAGLFGALLAITRPEGPLLAVAALIAGRGSPWSLLGPLLATGGWWAVRVQSFGLWMSLPAYVKLSPSPAAVRLGLEYLVGALAPVAALLGLAAWATPRARRTEALLDLAPLWVVIALCLLSGGDWMRHGRFVAPALPFVFAVGVPAVRAWLRAPRTDGVPDALWLCAVLLAPQAVEGIGTRVAPPLPMSVQANQGEVLYRAARSACGDSFPFVATPDVGGVLWEYPHLKVADLGGLTEPDLVGRVPGAYWPERLRERPVHAVYLHSNWSRATGLTDEAMRHAGYQRVCRRGEDAKAPTLWLHRRCDLGLSGTDLELVEHWCRFGARGGLVPPAASARPAE